MGPNASAPGRKPVFVTASDSVNIPSGACRGLLVGTAGAARLLFDDGYDTGASNLVPLQAGYNPIAGVVRVYSTGLGASNIWALY